MDWLRRQRRFLEALVVEEALRVQLRLLRLQKGLLFFAEKAYKVAELFDVARERHLLPMTLGLLLRRSLRGLIRIERACLGVPGGLSVDIADILTFEIHCTVSAVLLNGFHFVYDQGWLGAEAIFLEKHVQMIAM